MTRHAPTPQRQRGRTAPGVHRRYAGAHHRLQHQPGAQRAAGQRTRRGGVTLALRPRRRRFASGVCSLTWTRRPFGTMASRARCWSACRTTTSRRDTAPHARCAPRVIPSQPRSRHIVAAHSRPARAELAGAVAAADRARAPDAGRGRHRRRNNAAAAEHGQPAFGRREAGSLPKRFPRAAQPAARRGRRRGCCGGGGCC